jgi:cyclic pyranopterin phosphate synthase
MSTFTHLNKEAGYNPVMVNIEEKQITKRTATAGCSLELTHLIANQLKGSSNEIPLMQDSSVSSTSTSSSSKELSKAMSSRIFQKHEVYGPKGPIFSTAIIAGIQAAKQTSQLIPLCHPLSLNSVVVDIDFCDQNKNNLRIECTVSCTGKTGVEMEALTGASTAGMFSFRVLAWFSQISQLNCIAPFVSSSIDLI